MKTQYSAFIPGSMHRHALTRALVRPQRFSAVA